jgi:N-acetylglucosaminyldiphosphoundecaprenol N-acetyl-beta-D-mannosaminyltransferase
MDGAEPVAIQENRQLFSFGHLCEQLRARGPRALVLCSWCMQDPRTTPPTRDELPSVSLMGLRLARIDRQRLLDHMFASLQSGGGGWLITANLDFLRRYVGEKDMRVLYDAAEIRVADGMPLVWACRLQGQDLPERVAGSSLVWLMIERAAQEGRSVYLLGGAPGVNERASKILLDKYKSLKLCGSSSPRISNPPMAAEIDGVLLDLHVARPDLLLVALGSPKQEQLIHALRTQLPSTWMVGIGISLSFITGDVKRAPPWMRKMGIEWLHRMLQEPRRLAKRYLIEDLPFAIRMFPHALLTRLKRNG